MADQATGSGIRDEIVRANERWMDAYRRHDAAGIAARYTEDAQVLPQGGDFVRGRQAVQNLFQALFDQGINMIELHTGEVEQHGERVIEVSTATLRGEGDQVIAEAKYIVVWKQEGGEWKLHLDIFNFNS